MPIQLAAWELPAASCHATWGSYASTVLSALSAESNPPMAKILHSAIIYTHLFTLTFTLTPVKIASPNRLPIFIAAVCAPALGRGRRAAAAAGAGAVGVVTTGVAAATAAGAAVVVVAAITATAVVAAAAAASSVAKVGGG